jgi:hypothetical protein
MAEDESGALWNPEEDREIGAKMEVFRWYDAQVEKQDKKPEENQEKIYPDYHEE